MDSPCMIFSCQWLDCQDIADSFEALKSHVISHYVDDMSGQEVLHLLSCRWRGCELVFANHQPVIQLFRHLMMHCLSVRLMHDAEIYRRARNLPECRLVKFHTQELMAHDLNQAWYCAWNGCPFQTDDVNDFYVHVQSHLKRFWSERGLPWVCRWEDCIQAKEMKEFSNSSNLKAHILSHTKEKRFACCVCCRHFTNQENFREHLMKQDESLNATARFSCKQCDQSFHRRPQLTAHVRSVHKPKLQCSLCPRQFDCEAKMSQHLDNVHKENRDTTFKCSYCHYTYKSRRGLMEHVRSKHQDSSLQCTDCEFETRVYSRMWRHIFDNHLSRFYSCHICGFRASAQYRFSRHLRGQHKLTPGHGFRRFQYRCTEAGVYQVVRCAEQRTEWSAEDEEAEEDGPGPSLTS